MVRESQPYRIARAAYRRGFTPLALNPFLQWAAPGHFYSPIPNAADVARRESATSPHIPGIDTRDAEQLALLAQLAAMTPPFGDEPTAALRFGYRNNYFSYSDGSVLYALLQTCRPKRIIEVGSGFSTAVMLDAGVHTHLTCIEPYPDRLRSKLRDGDRVEILEMPVQHVSMDRYDALESGDLLFIDSSHVAKVGSDVTHLLTKVLPRLKPGVLVHIHDIFWPFEYSADWLEEGRGWTEAYLVRAFLQFNSAFQIVWFTDYLAHHHRAELEARMPIAAIDGGSLYLRRV